MFSDRRVNKLRLRANCSEYIRRGEILCEDALNSASFSGIPQNGLVLIKRLNIGKISIRTNSSTLARKIEGNIENIRPIPIDPMVPDIPGAECVWFKDEIEPYILLTSLISRNEKPVAWYWRKAVPEWNPQHSKGKALKHILLASSNTQVGLVGTALIMDKVIRTSGADILLEILNPDDGHALAHLPGIVIPDISQSSTGQTMPSPFARFDRPWQKTLTKWVPYWGGQDIRSVWLANLAAVSVNPSYTASSVTAIINNAVELSSVTKADKNQAERENDPIQPISFSKLNVKPSLPDKTTHLEQKANRQYTKTEKSENFIGQFLTERRHDSDGISASHSKHRTSIEFSKNRTVSGLQGLTFFDTDNRPEIGVKSGVGIKPAEPSIPPDDEEMKLSPSNMQGKLSMYAGFPFLISVMERLGIRETLKSHPHLADLNLPSKILWKCKELLGVHPDDPICRLLTIETILPDQAPLNFVSPQLWWELFASKNAGTIAIRRVKRMPGKRLLYEPNGKILLACLNHSLPEELRTLARGFRLTTMPPIENSLWDPDLIISGYFNAMKYFIETYAEMSIQELVERPGYVAITRTHLNVTFNINQTDINVRKMGLDIDPGWVDWLGRVVYYHYLSETDW